MRQDSYPRSWTYTTAQLNEVDALKLSVTTAVAIQTYTGAAFDGGVGAQPRNARSVTVTTGASAATYNTTDPIVVTGRRNGVIVSENLLLTAAGGGETVRGTQLFDTITSVVVPAQLIAAVGTFKFGYGDVGCTGADRFGGISTTVDGTVRIGYGQLGNDSVPIGPGSLAGLGLLFERVIADQATGSYGEGATTPTSVGFTVYASPN